MMGAHLNPRAFLSPNLLFLTLFITLIAVVSKMAGAYIGCLNEDRRTRFQAGVCMIPRGEVGIIVGLVGIKLATISLDMYTVVLGMSLLTTIIAPPLVVMAFRGRRRGRPSKTSN
jgi:Kef-type K+ transport system membrane component KefB